MFGERSAAINPANTFRDTQDDFKTKGK